MNQVFSFKRYAWLMKRQFMENKKAYLWGIGILLAMIVLSFMMFGQWTHGKTTSYFGQEEVFLLNGFICLLFFAGTFYESFSSKYKGMFYFSLPTSSLEKLAVSFTYVMVLFPMVYIGIYYLADFFAVQHFNAIHGTDKSMYHLFSTDKEPILMILFLMPIFALCSLMFGKVGIVKTGFVVLAVVLLFVGLSKLVYGQIIPVKPVWETYSKISFKTDQTSILLEANNFFGGYVFWYLFIPVCWVVYYFKLKEKEV